MKVIIKLIILLIPLIFTGCKKNEPPKEEVRKQIQNISVYTMNTESIRDTFSLTGRVEAWEDIMLISELGGTIGELNVKEGDFVKKGQLLIKVDEQVYKAALNQAESLANLAEAEYKREQALFNEGLSSQSMLDKFKAEFQVRESSLATARLTYNKSLIISPIDGVLTYLEIEKGESLAPGSPSARVVNIDKLKIIAEVPEREINSVNKGDEVEIFISSINNLKLTGKVYFISTVSMGPGRTYPVKIEIDNSEKKVKPGMIARTIFRRPLIDDALLIPQESLIVNDGRKWVFVVNGNKAYEREVQTGIYAGNQIEIVKGLSAGEIIVVKGHQSLIDGEDVRYEKEKE